MSVLKKIAFVCTAALLGAFACGCDDGPAEGESVKDALCGVLVVFYGDNGALTGEDIDDDDALVCYLNTSEYEGGEGTYISHISPELSFGDLKVSMGSELREMSFTVYYTAELGATAAAVRGVYRTPQNTYYAEETFAKYDLAAILSAGVDEDYGTVDPDDDCEITVAFECVEQPSVVEVLQFDDGDQMIDSVVWSGQQQIELSKECAWAVVKQSYVGENGQSYSERTLFERSAADNGKASVTILQEAEGGLVEICTLELIFG